MTRVIHTADTHVGYRQYHRPERRQDFLAAFRQVVEDPVADDVDAVVHAGDLFHDRRPDLPDLLGVLDVLRELDDAGVPFLAVVGNHESKREAQWLDLYESLGLATRLGAEPVEVGDVALYGLDFVPRSRREELAYDFAPTDADHVALVAHGLFTPFEFGEWDAEAVLEAADVDVDAMLLGDNHDPGRAEVGDAWVTYAGSTERAAADERAERGYNIVTFDDETGVRIARRGLDTREFVFVDLELAEGEGLDRVRERLRAHDLDGAVVVVTVDGEGESFAPARVEEFATDRGALVARVTDRRELADAADDVDVAFADPDDAVRERVRELGLSAAARDLDETVRASKVADSNVTATVEERVTELLEAADAEAFEPAPNEGPAADEEDGGAEADDDASGAAPTDEPGEESDAEAQASMEDYL